MNPPPDIAAAVESQAATLGELAGRALEASAPACGDLAALPPDTIRRMFHELQVHQIELEMQNDELRRAQEQLAASQARFFDLYELAPVGYVTLSEAGLILEANLAAIALLGAPRGEIVRQPLTRFIFRDHRPLFSQYNARLFASGTPQAWELRMLDRDGAACWTLLSATLVPDGDGQPLCRAVLTDVTSRREAEEMLRESEERYR